MEFSKIKIVAMFIKFSTWTEESQITALPPKFCLALFMYKSSNQQLRESLNQPIPCVSLDKATEGIKGSLQCGSEGNEAMMEEAAECGGKSLKRWQRL